MTELERFLNLNGMLSVDPKLEALEQRVSAPQISVQPVSETKGQALIPGPIQVTEEMAPRATTEFLANTGNQGYSISRDRQAEEIARSEALETRKNDAREMALDSINRYARSSPAGPQFDYQGEYDALKKESDSIKVPQNNLLAQAIASLGPALAGLAVGGQAGYMAGGKGGEQSADSYQKFRESEIKGALGRKEEVSKRLVGLSQLLNASANASDKVAGQMRDKAKFEFDAFRNLFKDDQEMQKYIEDNASKLDSLTLGFIKDFGLATSKDQQFGEKLGADSEIERFKQEMANKRAAMMAAAAAKRQQDRPLSESQAKNAFNYAMAGQANAELQEIKKAVGALPSETDRFFPFFKQLAQGEYTDIAATIAGPEIPELVKEQVAAELLFLEAIGRAASGAAIASHEWRNFEGQYFTRKGDNATVAKRKENARARAVDMFGVASGPGRALVPAPNPTPTKPQTTGQDPKVAEYAKKFNLSYEKANQIIEKRKAGK